MKFPSYAKNLTTSSLFVAIKEHLYSDLNGEAVILSTKNGKYYGLNQVGRSIWKAIKNPTNLEEIQTRVMDEYEVDNETCNREVSSFLKTMWSEGLIEVLDEKTV
ncbi:MAG: lasso peptide biosynthesis PqqD family chaperone [Acidobacteria bacterium]|nr:lasso peptide biosynthesis PqqD family chaperone [Acidobacteriota bacterium]